MILHSEGNWPRSRTNDPRSYTQADPVGLYTQADPIGVGDQNLFSYTSVNANPLIATDPLGLYIVKDKLVKKPTPNPMAFCGSPFACSKVSAVVICSCECDALAGHVFPNVELWLMGEMAYHNGPFGAINQTPVDLSVTNKATAIAHEYSYHIDKAVAAVDSLLKGLESTGFNTPEACVAACNATSVKVNALFLKTLKETQAAENSQ